MRVPAIKLSGFSSRAGAFQLRVPQDQCGRSLWTVSGREASNLSLTEATCSSHTRCFTRQCALIRQCCRRSRPWFDLVILGCGLPPKRLRYEFTQCYELQILPPAAKRPLLCPDLVLLVTACVMRHRARCRYRPVEQSGIPHLQECWQPPITFPRGPRRSTGKSTVPFPFRRTSSYRAG